VPFALMVPVAVLCVIIALLELGLSETQKNACKLKFMRVWNWLDEAKSYTLFDWIRLYYKWIVGAAILIEGVYVAWIVRSAFAVNAGGLPATLTIGIIIAAISFWLGLKIIRATLRARSLGIALLRSTLLLMFAFTPFFLIAAVAPAFKVWVLPSLLSPNPAKGIASFKFLTISLYVLSIHCTAILLIFWLAVAAPVAFLYALSGMLSISDFTVRRLAEYPKSLLGVGAVFGGVATLLKVFDRH
jgi:hypothetical protein